MAKILTKEQIEALYKGSPKDESGHVLAFGRSVSTGICKRNRKKRELTLDDFGTPEYDRMFTRKTAPTAEATLVYQVEEQI
jgi:hypothetical protein